MYSGQKKTLSGNTSIIEKYILKVLTHLKRLVEVPPWKEILHLRKQVGTSPQKKTILLKSKISHNDPRCQLHQPSRNSQTNLVPQSLKQVCFLKSPNQQDQSKVKFLLHPYQREKQRLNHHCHPQPLAPPLHKSIWLYKQQLQLHKQVIHQQCHRPHDQLGHHPNHMMGNPRMPQHFGMF